MQSNTHLSSFFQHQSPKTGKMLSPIKEKVEHQDSADKCRSSFWASLRTLKKPEDDKDNILEDPANESHLISQDVSMVKRVSPDRDRPIDAVSVQKTDSNDSSQENSVECNFPVKTNNNQGHESSNVKGVILTKPNFYDGKINLMSSSKRKKVSFTSKVNNICGFGETEGLANKTFQFDDKSDISENSEEFSKNDEEILEEWSESDHSMSRRNKIGMEGDETKRISEMKRIDHLQKNMEKFDLLASEVEVNQNRFNNKLSCMPGMLTADKAKAINMPKTMEQLSGSKEDLNNYIKSNVNLPSKTIGFGGKRDYKLGTYSPTKNRSMSIFPEMDNVRNNGRR